MTVQEFIIVMLIVGISIAVLVAFFAWVFVKLFLLRWEQLQSETIVSQEAVSEKFVKEYPLTSSDAFDADGLLELENSYNIKCNPSNELDFSKMNVLYRGVDVETLSPDECIKAIKHIAKQNEGLFKINKAWKEASDIQTLASLSRVNN